MKAKIIKIGEIENGNPVGWSFDSYTNVPALQMSGRGTLYHGYSVKELEEIYYSFPQSQSLKKQPDLTTSSDAVGY